MSASERRIAELEDEVHKLKYLLSQQMRTGEELEIEAIVNPDGVALVNLRWDQLATQMPSSVAREMFVEGLRVCEWADVDAKVLAGLRKIGCDEKTCGAFMAMLREERGGHRDAAAVSVAGGPADG